MKIKNVIATTAILSFLAIGAQAQNKSKKSAQTREAATTQPLEVAPVEAKPVKKEPAMRNNVQQRQVAPVQNAQPQSIQQPASTPAAPVVLEAQVETSELQVPEEVVKKKMKAASKK